MVNIIKPQEAFFMVRKRKLTEGKKKITAGLIEEYDIKTANDIQEALKDLLGGTIQDML